MHTFNLGFVFGKGEGMSIIVCASEDPIDRHEVAVVATQHFHQAVAAGRAIPGQVLSDIVDGIRSECGCNAVIVNADAACIIARPPGF